MPVYLYNGAPLVRDGALSVAESCCCGGCCCTTITLNDLLYGAHEYSWPTIEPAVESPPQFGAGTATQPSVPAEYTAVGTQWVSVGGRCYEKTTILDPQPSAATAGKVGCGVRLEQVAGQWAEIERHCFNWKPCRACLRWVCRCVDGFGNITCESVYGGPTTTNKDLSALVTEAMGPEPTAGCYVYTVQFFGWQRSSCGSAAAFTPGDDMYSVYRTQITSCP